LLLQEPHYVRCIKPNDIKSAAMFDEHRVKHQVSNIEHRIKHSEHSIRSTTLWLVGAKFDVIHAGEY
jgi:hypothetical protein